MTGQLFGLRYFMNYLYLASSAAITLYFRRTTLYMIVLL